jgi:hypothetical protein
VIRVTDRLAGWATKHIVLAFLRLAALGNRT